MAKILEKKVVFLKLGNINGVVRSQDYIFEEELLFETTGRHEVCDGAVDFYPISEEFSVMLCRKCGLRVPYPKTAQNWKQMAEYIERVKSGKDHNIWIS